MNIPQKIKLSYDAEILFWFMYLQGKQYNLEDMFISPVNG